MSKNEFTVRQLVDRGQNVKASQGNPRVRELAGRIVGDAHGSTS